MPPEYPQTSGTTWLSPPRKISTASLNKRSRFSGSSSFAWAWMISLSRGFRQLSGFFWPPMTRKCWFR